MGAMLDQPMRSGWALRPPVLFLARYPTRPTLRRLLPVAKAGSSKPRGSWGSTNRLGAAGEPLPGYRIGVDDSIPIPAAYKPAAEGQQRWPWWHRTVSPWLRSWDDLWGKAAYQYYLWRKDTTSDLQLFMVMNAVLLLGAAYVQGAIISQIDSDTQQATSAAGIPGWWVSFYAVLVWLLGQDLPSLEASPLTSQVFAVAVVLLGLVSFALVLALVEQVVLEVLEGNVRKGSQVYEEGHIVVLSWCQSAYDLSQLTRILGQVCHANGDSQGGAVVVLAQEREKLELEAIFRKSIPESMRCNTKIVFRQGSPLDPDSLRKVAVTKARAVIVMADASRSAQESDAQCLRAALLLDEMVDEGSGAGAGGGPSIVFQVLNANTITTVAYACSGRVIPVPTGPIQARRIARIVRNPIVAVVSNMLTDWKSSAHFAFQEFPFLVGIPFRDVHLMFPSATIVGVCSGASGRALLNPSPGRLFKPGDQLVMLRPGSAGNCPESWYTTQPIPADIGDWNPGSYTLHSQDEEPLGVDINSKSDGRRTPKPLSDYLGATGNQDDEEADDEELPQLHQEQKRGVFVLPLQYSSSLTPSGDLLILGWGRSYFMWSLIASLDHGPQALPQGTCVTLFNEHSLPPGFEDGLQSLQLRHIKADPRNMSEVRAHIDIACFKSVVVIADAWWGDGGGLEGDRQAYRNLTQGDLLRIDAAVLLSQLNIRTLLAVGAAISKEQRLPDLSIVVQRMTMVGSTKFEDPSRLPLGLPVNPASFVGKVLTQVAFQPLFLRAYAELGVQSDIVVQDSSAFTAPGEELSYFELQARAVAVQQILLGYYRIPSSSDQALDVVVNPNGLKARSERIVWTRGDGRCKLLTLARTTTIRTAQSYLSSRSTSDASGDSDESQGKL